MVCPEINAMPSLFQQEPADPQAPNFAGLHFTQLSTFFVN
jgi:hypothetical protein